MAIKFFIESAKNAKGEDVEREMYEFDIADVMGKGRNLKQIGQVDDDVRRENAKDYAEFLASKGKKKAKEA